MEPPARVNIEPLRNTRVMSCCAVRFPLAHVVRAHTRAHAKQRLHPAVEPVLLASVPGLTARSTSIRSCR